jgi:hypothetical protein
VRSPGFEPGLSGWEPDVLTKLDYNRTETLVFRWTKINKLVPQTSNNEKIHDLLTSLESSGLDEDTVTCIGYKLSDINQEVDINNTEQTALFISINLSVSCLNHALFLSDIDCNCHNNNDSDHYC